MESQQDRLSKHNLKASLRTRERNNLESKRLDRQLSQLDWDKRRAGSLIEREMRLLSRSVVSNDLPPDDASTTRPYSGVRKSPLLFIVRDESRIGTPLSSRPASRLLHTPNSLPILGNVTHVHDNSMRLHRLHSGRERSGATRRSHARKSARKSRGDTSPCRFGTVRGNCNHFPCSVPNRYTSIGFPLAPINPETDDSPRITSAQRSSLNGRERLLHEVEALSVRRPLMSAADQTNHKEKTLKKIIDDMKVRKTVCAPDDWTVNYGKPVPFRKLMRPARPTYGET